MNTGRFQVFYFFSFPAYLTFWIFCFSEYQACIFFFSHLISVFFRSDRFTTCVFLMLDEE